MAEVVLELDGKEIRFAYDRLLMAGYAGRNQEEVRAHIEELKQHGVPAPDRTPTLFMCDPLLLTTGEEVPVLGDATSGEAEFVLFLGGEEVLVGVGSDHTDRELEKTDIPRAKQLCRKVVSRQVWRLRDVRDRWDDLILRAWVGEAGPEVLYQEAPLAALMTPESLVEYVESRVAGGPGRMVLYSGTVSIRGGKFLSLPYFKVQLEDPRTGRCLEAAYRAVRLDYVR